MKYVGGCVSTLVRLLTSVRVLLSNDRSSGPCAGSSPSATVVGLVSDVFVSVRPLALPLNVMARTVELVLDRSPDSDGAPSNSEIVGKSVWESREGCPNAEVELELEAFSA